LISVSFVPLIGPHSSKVEPTSGQSLRSYLYLCADGKQFTVSNFLEGNAGIKCVGWSYWSYFSIAV